MTWYQLLWRYLTIQRHSAIALLILAAISATLDVAFPWLLQEAVDAALGDRTRITFDTAIACMAIVAVLGSIGLGIANWIESRMFAAASSELRFQLIRSYFARPIGFLRDQHSAQLVHRVSSCVTLLQQMMIELFSEMPFALFVAGGVLLMMSLTDLRLTALVVVQLAIAAFVTERFGGRLPTVQRLSQRLGAGLSGLLQESLSAMKIIRANGAEGDQIHRMQETNRRIIATEYAAGNLRALTAPIWGLVESLCLVVILWYGGRLLINGSITIGSLVAFITYVELLSLPVRRAGEFYYEWQICRATAERIASILPDDEELEEETSGLVSPQNHDIEFDRVEFSYADAQTPVLKDFSLRIEDGESLALCGRNGVGKSTLLDLLLRFHEPTKGRIFVGDLNLADCDLIKWRMKIGFVPQESMLISGTLADNVAMGLPETTAGQAQWAIEQAAGPDWLARFPDGIRTFVGERGTQLSGGERQLIALARLFLRDPEIILLDEPTAHLDGETLERVDQVIKNLMTNRTVILVSHRPETIRLASRIVILEHGQIVDDGTHDSLMESSNRYRQLINVPMNVPFKNGQTTRRCRAFEGTANQPCVSPVPSETL